jgi:hypothetical protein
MTIRTGDVCVRRRLVVFNFDEPHLLACHLLGLCPFKGMAVKADASESVFLSGLDGSVAYHTGFILPGKGGQHSLVLVADPALLVTGQSRGEKTCFFSHRSLVMRLMTVIAFLVGIGGPDCH